MSGKKTRRILQWRSGNHLVTFNKVTGGSFVLDNTYSPKYVFDFMQRQDGDGYKMPLTKLKKLWPVDRWIVR